MLHSSNLCYVKVISNGEGNSERDVKPNDALNGIGTDVLVKFDVSSNIKIPTLDDKSQRVVDKERPHEIGLGHELVHGIRSMEGKAVDYKIRADYQYFNSKGQKNKVRESLEELETDDLRGTYRYSENKLRIEHKLGKRGAY